MEIYKLLEQHKIPYQRIDHEPVYTCEEADQLLPKLGGAKTKNLFLRDRKGKRHFLVVVSGEKSVDLKQLASMLEINALSFASAERLDKHLKLQPGAVSVLGILNDHEHNVELVIDEPIINAEAVQCHPLVNTATLVIRIDELKKLLQAENRDYQVIAIPQK